MSLIEQLVSSIGLTPQQAEGAVGAVGRLAQGKLPPELFSELGTLIPGLSGMIGGAPKPSGMAAMLGEKAGLASVLNQLGIDLGKAGPIIQILTTFIQAQGSGGLQAALTKLVGR
jgi:hypothetical protein